jgi:hypothetical protein
MQARTIQAGEVASWLAGTHCLARTKSKVERDVNLGSPEVPANSSCKVHTTSDGRETPGEMTLEASSKYKR